MQRKRRNKSAVKVAAYRGYRPKMRKKRKEAGSIHRAEIWPRIIIVTGGASSSRAASKLMQWLILHFISVSFGQKSALLAYAFSGRFYKGGIGYEI